MKNRKYIYNKQTKKYAYTLNSKIITVVTLLTAVVGIAPASSTIAKSAPSNTPVPTVTGPCVYEWITDFGHVMYPLTNDKYPGVVSVDMYWSANDAPTVKSICLDEGWTVESKTVTGGVQLRFSYSGIKAIDFKFVLGKTDIRNY